MAILNFDLKTEVIVQAVATTLVSVVRSYDLEWLLNAELHLTATSIYRTIDAEKIIVLDCYRVTAQENIAICKYFWREIQSYVLLGYFYCGCQMIFTRQFFLP